MYDRREEKITSSVDWLTIALYLILIVGGWLSIYGASYDYESAKSMFDLSGRAGMQLVWMGTSLILAFIILKLDSSYFDSFAYIIYLIFIGLLVVTFIFATEVRGSRSWLTITSSIRIQPAEFAKFGVALALAKFMNSYNFKLMDFSSLVTIAIMLLLPMGLILLEKETGTALVYTVLILVLYREGLPGVILFIIFSAVVFFIVGLKFSESDVGMLTEGEFISAILVVITSALLIVVYVKDNFFIPRNIVIGASVIFGVTYILTEYGVNIDMGIVALAVLAILVIYLLVLAIRRLSKVYMWIAIFIVTTMGFVYSTDYMFNDILQPHQQIRIKIALGMEQDLMGAGYNVNQSKIAIGSGGFLGKGFLNGTQTKLKYVPEQDTDFIFCTVGEEQGFVGSVTVLLLFLILILRLFHLAERQTSTFGRVYGYSAACIFLFHVAINIGMVIGLTPVIGIPLPFFSYGGSSLWGFSILLFIFLRIDMRRKHNKIYS